MQYSESLKIEQPSLPAGGGTLNGMGESLAAAGPDGTASLSIPLPVSAGRGVAPALTLSYSSAAGNGAFALGWQCEPGFISRQTSQGVPRYDEEDKFLAPNGEVLVPMVNAQGQQQQRTADSLLGTRLSQPYLVTRWQPRIVTSPSRIEYWQPQQPGEEKPFWVLFAADGQVHLFGKHDHARVADPQDKSHVARWLMEETVTPTGEHIYYYWRGEDDVGCDERERLAHPVSTAQRYLAKVSYGNIKPGATFMALENGVPSDHAWLFHLVFDYGERPSSLAVVPQYAVTTGWQNRPDSFSRYDYGFEIRTRRLCHQVLMFHRLQTLEGKEVPDETPALVGRTVLEYDLNPRVSLLLSACNLAHENDGTPVMQPPLELDYQRFDAGINPSWQEAPQPGKLNAFQPWQMVDLYGEGLPGLLYQDIAGAWWYQAPVRDSMAENSDAVAYEAAQPLPAIPAQQESALLMDISGDGRLDWVITHSGVQGYHSMQPDKHWTSFIPLASIPLEYFHPQALLADITGAGLPDLAMIGPSSVRFWTNNRKGWRGGQTAVSEKGSPLPIPGRDARVLVGFSDINASGRSHLIRIAADDVSYWPNLGHGQFGQPISIPGFTVASDAFNPDRLYLADIDGSGTTDLIYAHSDHLALYINESGNRFADPLRLPMPGGVRFDDNCRLQIADINGQGTGSLLLTVPHMTVKHWRMDLTADKPWLLNEINNNMGASTRLHYRSSAQFWLDEKSQAVAEGRTVASYLPFPVHLLWRTLLLDEITGNRLSSKTEYAHGVWDGREREYRGFARVIQTDLDELADGSRGTDLPATAPVRSVSWFATGLPAVDNLLPDEFWGGDDRAFPYLAPRFTRYEGQTEGDVVITPDAEQAYWLNRALKGTLLRRELYGADETEMASIPYAVSESRPQIRLIPGLTDENPAAMVSTAESREWQYERVISDPRCNQTLVLKNDEFGFPLEVLSVAYPRRQQPAASPYPETLPETLFSSSYDEQQNVLRLELTRTSCYHLENEHHLLSGLLNSQRIDVSTLASESLPAQGLSLEWASGAGKHLLPGGEKDYCGHQSIHYVMSEGAPTFPPRIAYSEKAAFDEESLKAFRDILQGNKLADVLKEAGWIQVTVPFQQNPDFLVWASQQEFTDFAGAEGFYRPLAHRHTLLTGKRRFDWDRHYCAVIREQGSSLLEISASYDYRFLTPFRITDENDNIAHITMDASGRLTSIRFWGDEGRRLSGYTAPEEASGFFRVPTTVDEALGMRAGIPVAGCIVYSSLSWMPQITGGIAELLLSQSADNRIGRLALKRWLKRHPEKILTTNAPLPPHTLTIKTDRYDSDPQQQLSQHLDFIDGFNRLLQTSVRHEAGEAWLLNNGALVTGNAGQPQSEYTDFRWAVSGRNEYDAKGRLLRTYQPYFLNSWRYVHDDSARQDLYSDVLIYDPLDRNVAVITAAGWLRRTLITPWFVVNEDENDTSEEILRASR